jgi:hypothetical protein
MWQNCYTFYLGSRPSPLETLSRLQRPFPRTSAAVLPSLMVTSAMGRQAAQVPSDGPNARDIREGFSHRKPFKRKTGEVVPQNMECVLASNDHPKCGLQLN